ncbi:hypothetical protein H6762_03260 [Candidatus Nomurabacteria bacterium]|nr:hypothetical protein [Candidatus Nomurabacteria bacterium]
MQVCTELKNIYPTDFPREGGLDYALNNNVIPIDTATGRVLVDRLGILIARGNEIPYGVRDGNTRLAAIYHKLGPDAEVEFTVDETYNPDSIDTSYAYNEQMGIANFDDWLKYPPQPSDDYEI